MGTNEDPPVDKFRKLLECLIVQQKQNNVVGFQLDNNQRKTFQEEISKQLSKLLLEKNGLTYLLLACEDLGGDSFWENSVALATVVKLLSKKPSFVKSGEKYYAYILKHLLILFKDKQWNLKLALLFPIAMTTFSRVAPMPFLVNIVDKLLRPFDLMLERGNLNKTVKEDQDYECEATNSGIWTEQHSASIWKLPFWIHFLGQAAHLLEEQQVESLQKFAADFAIIQKRLLMTLPSTTVQADYYTKHILLQPDSKRAYFELKLVQSLASPIASTSKCLIQPVSEETTNDKNSIYPFISVIIREEAFEVQDCVDFQFAALDEFLKKMTKKDSALFLFSMLSEVSKSCQRTPIRKKNDALDTISEMSTFRFLGVKDTNISQDDESMFLPHYILTRLADFLSKVDFTSVENMFTEGDLIKVVHSTEEITESYKKEISSSQDAEAINASVTQLSDIIDGLDEEEPSLCGHALVELAKAFRQRNTNLFHEASKFDLIFDKLIELTESEDSFVFLAVINALAELSYWKSEPFLGRLVKLFVEWSEIPVASHDDEDAKVLAQKKIMNRCKVGEALSKVCKQLGDFSPVYFDQLSNTFLSIVECSKDEMVQASAISSLADLILACRGRYFDKMLQELLLCVNQILSSSHIKRNFSNGVLLRRAAIYLLRSMVMSTATAGNSFSSMLEAFGTSLAPLTRELKRLWSSDEDDVVRLHSELALIEIQESFVNSFHEQ
ncbi:transport and Golgi organization protein 6 like protein [Ditylenchus destructor]|nr:transport and Golgi organization protein 6 like protein [Ditylenchus destructor]